MTHQEIVRGFTTQLDKIDSFAFVELESSEKLYYINKHILKTVSNKYAGYNIISKGFEETELRTSELKNLVKEVPLSLTAPSVYNTEVSNSETTISLDPNYLYLLRHSIEYRYLKKNCTTYSNWLKGNIYKSTLDNIEKLLDDPFNIPKYKDILIEIIDNKIRFYYASNIQLQNYILTYLKKPTLISNPSSTIIYSELPDKVLYEVITSAVQEVLENLESDRLQTIQTEINKET